MRHPLVPGRFRSRLARRTPRSYGAGTLLVALWALASGACALPTADADPRGTDEAATRTDASATDALVRADALATDASPSPSPDAGATDAAPSPSPDASATDAAPSPSPDASAPTSCWPFERPSITTLRASRHKVFAHYFSSFPLSIDNRDPSVDYYTRGYLAPDGENGIHRPYGGMMRDRPVPRAVRAETNWKALDLDQEVRRAVAAGLDGFTFDILGTNVNGASSRHWPVLLAMLAAAQRVDPGFRIVLMPDMTTEFATRPENMVPALLSVAHHPSVLHTDDGALVIAPFAAERRSPDWWRAQLDAMRAQGVRAVLMPMFLWLTESLAASYAPVSFGLAESMANTASSAASSLPGHVTLAHRYVGTWMGTAGPQAFRPREQRWWEASNSLMYRNAWEAQIRGGADWVQMMTWNDYGEATEVSPSAETGWGFYDLTAYYATWFKTGAALTVVRDGLYYFHRNQLSSAAPDLRQQTAGLFRRDGSDPARDEVELVALLKSPGTLEITQGSAVSRRDVGAGLQSLRAPLRAGTTPAFRLLRNGVEVVRAASRTPVKSSIVFQDLLYRGGSSAVCARP